MGPALGELSEADVLARILPILPRGRKTLIGPGDDSAVVELSDARVVVSTDSMIEGPDFRREWSTPFDIGWKIAAVNLADIAAMGANPIALVVAFAAPPETPIDDLVGIAEGLAAACQECAPGVGVVGGDLASAPVLTLAVTAFGELDGRSAIRRSGAQPGDVIAHAGQRGAAARGLSKLFSDAVDANRKPDAARADALRTDPDVVAQLRPRPAIAAGIAAGVSGAHAMLDVSDGLAQDAERLALASGVGITFDDTAFVDEWELHGGEDHGMLAAFDPETALPEGFTRIGIATPGAVELRWRGSLVTPRRWEALHDWHRASGGHSA
ncbi:MAG: thiamine-phosphate kinase [Agromyces sp.]